MPRAVRFWVPLVAGLLLAFRAVAAPPDSLLALPRARRLVALAEGYDRAWKRDTLAALRLGAEWWRFFENQGTDADLRLLEVAALEVFRDAPALAPRFLARAYPLLGRAEARADTLVMARLHADLGMCFFHVLKKYDRAFRHYDQAFNLLKHQTEADYADRDYTIYLIGLASYEFFDYENAIRYGQALTDPLPGGVTHTHLFNACLLGLSYLKLNRYDQARQWFEWGLRRLPIRKDFPNDAWVGIFKGHLGLVLLARHRPEEALPCLREGIERTAPAGVWNSVATFGTRLSGLHLARGEWAQAGAYARQAHAAARRLGEAKHTHETHAALAAWLGATGQPALALRHADSAAADKDRYRAEIDLTLKHRAELAAAAERHRANELLLQGDRDQQVLVRNGLLLLVLLGVAVAVLLYNRQVTVHRHRQARLRAEADRAGAELRQARAQLDDFRRSVREKSELLERLSGTAEAVPADVLVQLQRSVLVTDEGWRRFSDLFAKVHPGFLYRLREKHPGLSPAEVRLLALSRLGYSTREMAAMLGVGLNAIRQNRTRLRRKLGLPDEARIEDLAAEI